MSSVNNKKFWKGYGELENSDEFKEVASKEFQKPLDSDVSRREFIKYMGASVALAGLTGCGPFRKPKQIVRPYSHEPEQFVPGESRFYATSMNVGEDVLGLVVESHENRPTKIEGNPNHNQSFGKTGVYHQSSILDLYDPDRLKKPVGNWEQSLSIIQQDLKKNKGKKVVVVSEAQSSPTYFRLLNKLKKRYPGLKHFIYESINRENVLHGLKKITGQWISPSYDFEQANIVLSLDSDFLGKSISHVKHTFMFSKRRSVEHENGLNRLYVAESHFTITGGKADHRFQIKSSDIEGIAWLIAERLSTGKSNLNQILKSKAKKYKQLIKKEYIDAIVNDLLKNKGRSIVIAGENQPDYVHGLVFYINERLKNNNNVIKYNKLNFSQYPEVTRKKNETIKKIVNLIDNQSIEHMILIGGNIIYNTSLDYDLKNKFKLENLNVVHLTNSFNETSELSNTVIPRSHYLESWSDLVTVEGTASIVQPLINPQYSSITDIELISQLLGENKTGFSQVQSTWGIKSSQNKNWKKWLHDGIIQNNYKSAYPYTLFNRASDLFKIQPKLNNNEIELVFQPSYALYDGRFSNNGWLQELPDPVTKLTWDNAALMNLKTAEKLNLSSIKNPKKAPVIEIHANGRMCELPVLLSPGHADNSITINEGYGRSKSGRVGTNIGANVGVLKSKNQENLLTKLKVNKTSNIYALATTQEHGSMDPYRPNSSKRDNERPLYRSATLDYYMKKPKFAQKAVKIAHEKSLYYKEIEYKEGYQWGMAIDLGKCTGCNSCVIACQAENNIPIVGKKEVLNGREMHWLRIDRYYRDEEEKPKMVFQPIPCLHCENAPCESVCPVAATVHDNEGLNVMVYNRCVGTRYCANNCPVKVRRFNYFDYHQRNPQSVKKERKHFFDYLKEPDPDIQKQFNPDVTVRMRGVMEKCTLCIQRIKRAKTRAKLENRTVRDGEIQTACSQACPADGSIFGNILDPNSQISKARKNDLNYSLLEDLLLKPRVTFFAAITNPNPVIEKLEGNSNTKSKKIGAYG